jgi:hypothetical protein
MMYFGLPDRAVRVHRMDGAYEMLPAGAEEAPFDGYACRRIATVSMQAPRSIVGDFVAHAGRARGPLARPCRRRNGVGGWSR